MGRNRLAEGEKLKPLTIRIKEKHFKTHTEDELRAVAHKSVMEYVNSSKKNNNSLNQLK